MNDANSALTRDEERSIQRCHDDGAEPTSETNANAKQGGKLGCLFIAVAMITGIQLLVDLVTTILSFTTIASYPYDCCGTEFRIGVLTFAITLPYFILIIVELVILYFSVRQAVKGKDPHMDSAEEESAFEENDNLVNRPCECSPLSTLVSWLVVANPFFGCLMVWAMLHDLVIAESVIWVLGLEAGAVFLMLVTLFLQCKRLTLCTSLLHAMPLVSDQVPISYYCNLSPELRASLDSIRST